MMILSWLGDICVAQSSLPLQLHINPIYWSQDHKISTSLFRSTSSNPFHAECGAWAQFHVMTWLKAFPPTPALPDLPDISQHASMSSKTLLSTPDRQGWKMELPLHLSLTLSWSNIWVLFKLKQKLNIDINGNLISIMASYSVGTLWTWLPAY